MSQQNTSDSPVNFPKIHTFWIVAGVVLILVFWVGGVYNGLIGSRETVRTERGNLQSQYQRRYDLINNLVATVQGVADFEKSTLEAVIQARSKATSISLKTDDLTPEKLKEFQAAQGELSFALSRLLAVSEAYPELQATKSFLEFQVQQESTENRVQVAREKYNNTVKPFNTSIQTFPGNIIANIFGFKREEVFTADSNAQSAPKVQFNTNSSSASSSENR